MKVSAPLVSIIVPSFNQGSYIRETLESILNQDYRPLEILVIDGASTDQTVDILHEYDDVEEVQWVSEPDRGVVEAVNKGLARANGAIAAIQSSDDCYLPGAIDRAVQELEREPALGLVFGDVRKTDAEGHVISETRLKPFSLESFLSIQTWIPQPAAFFRLELARQAGAWCEEVPYAADTDLWLRMAFRAGVRKIDYPLATRRVHGAQRDVHGDRIIRDYCRMIDRSPEVASAPVRLRRAAAAGKMLQMNRYGYQDSHWRKFFRTWQAVLLYPALVGHISATALIPGWMQTRHLLSRTKKRLQVQ